MALWLKKDKKTGKSRWIADWYDPKEGDTYKRRRKSFIRKKDAEAHLSLVTVEKYKGSYHERLNSKSKDKITFRDFYPRYKKSFKNQRSWKKYKKAPIDALLSYFGDTNLSEISYYDIEQFRIQEEEKGLAVSTVNKKIAVLRNMLNKAIHFGLLKKSPLERKPSLMKKENNQVIRWLKQEEYHELLSNCHPVLHSMVVFAVNSGTRKDEILSLKWEQVKDGIIYLPDTKSNELQTIPINKVVAKTLDHLRKKNSNDSEFVFCKKNGARYSDIKTSFTTALKKSKIEKFRFHDLRHTFASWLVMRGVSLAIVQKLLRHKDYKTTLRYAHLADKSKEEAINVINELSLNAPPPKKPENPINRIKRMRKLRNKDVKKTT